MTLLETQYASANRAGSEKISNQQKLLKSIQFLQELINNISTIAIILNKDRQIIYTNQALIDQLKSGDDSEIIGKRPGEAINCKYAKNETGGCGTCENCSVCGAVNAILESQKSLSKIIKECRITTLLDDKETSLDLSVSATSLDIGGELFTIVSITDISDTKRKQALDRIFYHDVINTAGGIKGLAELALMQNNFDNVEDLVITILDGTKNLMEEITAQRDLSLAENNELAINITKFNVLEMLKPIIKLYKAHNICRNKILVLNTVPQELELDTDAGLLKRVIGNLVKNAIEASPKNSTIEVSCIQKENIIEFSVHNEGFMPREVQLQIFQRSFSTKGANRGLGTFSVKLLTERYLKGTVSFESENEKGTTFRIMIPINQDELTKTR